MVLYGKIKRIFFRDESTGKSSFIFAPDGTKHPGVEELRCTGCVPSMPTSTTFPEFESGMALQQSVT